MHAEFRSKMAAPFEASEDTLITDGVANDSMRLRPDDLSPSEDRGIA